MKKTFSQDHGTPTVKIPILSAQDEHKLKLKMRKSKNRKTENNSFNSTTPKTNSHLAKFLNHNFKKSVNFQNIQQHTQKEIMEIH